MSRAVGLGVFHNDDEPGARTRGAKTTTHSLVQLGFGKSRKYHKKSREQIQKKSRAKMASALLLKFCCTCGIKIHATFDPTAYDNAEEREKWHEWCNTRHCEDCKANHSKKGGDRFCFNCGVKLEPGQKFQCAAHQRAAH